jgi:hypothetical protein
MDIYERVIIRHLKGYIRKQYLEFLVKNGQETYKFYKHALKICRCIYLYRAKNTNDIKGIFGIYDTVSIEKWVATPVKCICFVSFIYCQDRDLFTHILRDIEQYAHLHGQPFIAFNHMTTYNDILIQSKYKVDDCSKHTICINCIQRDFGGKYDYKSNSYFKVIFNPELSRKVYDKAYDPNRDYEKEEHISKCPFAALNTFINPPPVAVSPVVIELFDMTNEDDLTDEYLY